MKDSAAALPVLYLAVFLLALNGLFAKLIVLDATSITCLRSAVAMSGFLVLSLMLKRRLRLQSLKQYIGVYLLGVLVGIHWTMFYYSMQVSTVAIGMLSLFSFPIITILLEPFFSGGRHSFQDIIAGGAVILGIGIMVSSGLNDLKGSVAQGVFWGVLSAMLFSLRNLTQKYFFSGISSEGLMFHQVIAVTVILAPFANVQNISAMPQSSWIGLILLGFISTAAAHTLYALSLKKLPAKSVALIGCIQPLIASVMAWLVLNEVPRLSVAVGGGLILSVAVYESLPKRIKKAKY